MKKNIKLITDQDIKEMSDNELKIYNQKIIFVKDGMPSEWLSYGEELMDAAELLWEGNENGLRVDMLYKENKDSNDIRFQEMKKVASISRTYFLLVGFAIENVIKGSIICNNPEYLYEGSLTKKLKSHKLINLASRIPEISLTNEEKNICNQIQEAIPYWGRYPIPLRYNQVLPDIGVTEENRKVILEIFDKFARYIYGNIKHGWDSKVGPKLTFYKNDRYE